MRSLLRTLSVEEWTCFLKLSLILSNAKSSLNQMRDSTEVNSI